MPRKQAEISREALFERLKYTPHSEQQWECHNSEARFRIPCCGRRWGKSTWAGHELTYYMFVPDSINWIVAPTYRLGEKEFRVVYNDFKMLKLLSRCKKQYNINQGNMRIEFTDLGSVLEVVSAEKQDSLVGEGLYHACMSEAALHRPSTWEMFIEPALLDHKGSCDFPSTPRGFNWYKGLWDIGQLDNPEFDEYESWRNPTWTNKALFPTGADDPEIVRKRNNVSTTFWAQEYAADFTSFEGMIYPDFDDNIHIRRINYQPAWKNYWVLDFGFTDPFVCLDIMVDPMDRMYIWREYQVSGKATSEHGFILKNRENPDGFHVNGIFADPRGADEIATLTMILGGINAHPVGWEQGVEAIRRQMKIRPDGTTGFYIDPSCTHSIRQFRNLRAKESREGHNAKPGQHDYDDHGPDAARYFASEYYVLGSGQSLASIYDGRGRGSAAESFFTHVTNITLNDRIAY